MTFANFDGFHILLTALALLFAAALAFASIRKYGAIRKQFSDRTFFRILRREGGSATYYFRIFLFGLSFVFLLITLYRPQWGENTSVSESNGVDVVFALDISQSMRALDFAQGTRGVNRLDMSKQMIKKFVQKHHQDRFALIVFAGDAFTVSPLTLDHETFLTFLDGVGFDDITKQGTNLAEALNTAVGRFLRPLEDEEQRGKMILVITDGEEQEGNLKAAAEKAKENDIPIVTVGVGTKEGSLIPVGQDTFGKIIYKEYQGRPVRTKLNEKPLLEIAQITGGKYFHPESETEFLDIEKETAKLKKSGIDREDRSGQEDRYQYFLFVSFVLFLLAAFLPRTIVYSATKP